MLPQEFHVISQAYARRDQRAIQLSGGLSVRCCGSTKCSASEGSASCTSSTVVSHGTSGGTITITTSTSDGASSALGLDGTSQLVLITDRSSASTSVSDKTQSVPSPERMQTLKIEFAEAFRAECDARSLRRRAPDNAPPGYPKLEDHWGDMNDAEKDALVTYMVGRLPKNREFDPPSMAQIGCFSVMGDLARYQSRKERRGKPKRKKIDSLKLLKDSLTNEIYVKYGVFSPHQWRVKYSKETEEPIFDDEDIIDAKDEASEASVESVV